MADVYSYHTFILPVILSGTGKAIHSFDQITKCFDCNSYWKRSDPKDKNSFPEDEDFRSFYGEYQYFYPQVRNALYGNDGSVVKTYTFAQEHVHEKAHYYITKKGRTYDLLINAIRLKIYNTGVALFIMECENHGKDRSGNDQSSFADIKNINDYGRRITLPFIPKDPANSSSADKLEMSIPGLDISIVSDFKGFIESVNTSENPKKLINLNGFCDYVKKLVNYGGHYYFSTNDETDAPKNAFRIRLALDDRMFVACLAINDKVAKKMTAIKKGNKKSDSQNNEDSEEEEKPFHELQYAYEIDEDLSKSLYEFIFIDYDGGCSCQSGAMRKELLDKHVYKRWLDYRSVYGFAAQSIVLLFDGKFEPSIISFLTIYEKIACLCIAQRASIIEFQEELSNLSVEIHDKGNRMRISTITHLMDLQERFAAFESQLCFTEISCQEQAIDIYEAMTNFFFIDDEMANIKSQLDVLNEAADTFLDFGFNKVGYIFTIVGAIFGVLGINWLTENPTGLDGVPLMCVCAALIGLVFLGVFIVYRRRMD